VSGAGSRRKGHDWERALVHRFREVMPDAEVRRGLQSRSGHEVADVETPIFWVESKRQKKANIRQALRQATASAPAGRVPVAVCKDDHEPATATLLLDDFLELIDEWWSRRR